MLKIILSLFLICILISCGQNTETKVDNVAAISDTATEKSLFFPVTTYIKGQISDIPRRGITPIKYTTKNNRTDSVWLKAEDLMKELAIFLEPEIDTANLTHMFSEKKFLDQTINAFTFTYDPHTTLPDSFQLQHWDVYVDPKANEVKRVYLLKKMPDGKTVQLTWQNDKWCKIVTLNEQNGKSAVEKEVLIKWDF